MNFTISYITNRLEPKFDWFFEGLSSQKGNEIPVNIIDFHAKNRINEVKELAKETAKATEGHCRPWNGSLVDVASARKIIAGVYFGLIKGADAQNADIGAVLQRAQDEYNALVE